MEKSQNKRVWVLTDDRPGNRTQSIGVAQKLPFIFEEKHLQFSALGGLPNSLLGASTARLDKASRAVLSPPWPDIAIAAGRRLAPALRYLKQQHPSCFTTYLMNPQMSVEHFDLVAIPEHDSPPPAVNVVPTIGPVHGLKDEILNYAAGEWRNKLAHLASPRIAVLVGGNSKSAEFVDQDFHQIGELSSNLARRMGEDEQHPASLLVTTSPRTDARAQDFLRLSLAVDHELFIWQRDAENPYHAFLALAKAIIVTGDSMSMCAEACSLGKPVFIYTPRGGKLAPKLQSFHQSLFERKLAQPLTAGVMPLASPGPTLNEAGRIAGEIMRRMG